MGLVSVEPQCRAVWVSRVWEHPRGQQLLAFPLGLMDLPGSFLEGAGLAANLRMLGEVPVFRTLFVPPGGRALNAAGVLVQSLFTLSRE